jgi:uncharacterized protein (TIGR03435 family)
MWLKPMAAMFAVLLVGPVSTLATAQNAQTAFEVAVIKPNHGNQGVRGGCRAFDSKLAANDDRSSVPVGRCVVTSGALRHMMALAFDMPLNRISGFPEWDGSNRFDVEARAEDPATTTEQQLLTMFQHFLIEEFRLTLRRETKDVPTFSLTVTRNGSKNLHPSEQQVCVMAAQPTGLGFRGCSMSDFAVFLSTIPVVQRPVTDATGLVGRYDFGVEMGSKLDGIVGAKVAMMGWDSIFGDIQDQLGLRFDRSTGPVDTLIIEHAALPHSGQ